MPIKDATIYPKYWKQFSAYIRFERADSKCEACEIPHLWWKVTYKRGFDGIRDFIGETLDGIIFDSDVIIRKSQVILTVAHLNAAGDVCDCQERTGFLCAKPEHVKAMCQQCHNRYDRPMRNRNARLTVQAKADSARGLFEQSRG